MEWTTLVHKEEVEDVELRKLQQPLQWVLQGNIFPASKHSSPLL